jgi:DNA-binding LytR/AlgR family response regulator
MTILLIEDEAAAAQRLRELVLQAEPSADISPPIESVAEAIRWLETNDDPDLIISDVQLADGICFDIFKQVKTTAPVIFTTAYDAYMLRAFKVNSIDYLLKPIDPADLRFAFSKYHALKQDGRAMLAENLKDLVQHLKSETYKTRFLVKQADRLLTINESNVQWLMADGNLVHLCTDTGERYIIDDPLDELETLLAPGHFFRLNRQYIARINAINQIHNHFNGRLKINLAHCKDNEVFVSREKAGPFKKWLNS